MKLPHFNKKRALIICVICFLLIAIEIGIVLAVYFPLVEEDKRKIRSEIEDVSSIIIDKVTEKLDLVFHNLDRNAAFFRISGIFISKANYTDMLQFDSLPIADTIESYIWIVRLLNSQLFEYQLFCNEFIKPYCFIYGIFPNGTENVTVAPVNITNEYYLPIAYSVPVLASGDGVIGLDMLSHPLLRELFIDIALTTTGPSMTIRSTLSRSDPNNTHSFGVAVMQSSFINPNFVLPESKNATLADIVGVMMGIVNVNDIFTNAIQDTEVDLERSDVNLLVFDVTPDDSFVTNRTNNISLLYKEPIKEYEDVWFKNQVSRGSDTVVKRYHILEREWRVFFVFSHSYLESKEDDLPIILVIVLSCIAMLINILLFIVYRAWRIHKKQLNTEREKITVTNQILSYVNHEVRNPLQIITNLISYNIENVRNEMVETKEEVVSDLHTALGACELLSHIVNDLLTIQRLEADKLELSPRVIILKDFLQLLEKTIMIKFNEKQTVKFIINVDPGLKKIYTDCFRLQQILLNYLTNAIKFTDEGSITLNIKRCNNDIVFSVEDTGRGINEEKKRIIFQPFSQVSTLDASRHGGSGLGLYLCKMLATKLRGSVGFESEYQVGSTFWASFPSSVIEHVPEEDV